MISNRFLVRRSCVALSVVVALCLVQNAFCQSSSEMCSCNTTETWDALHALFDATNGAYWSNSTHWLEIGSSVCDWYGVACHALTLQSNNLSGTIPEGIGRLNAIRILNLASNELSGTLPAAAALCGRWQDTLRRFHVQGNRLTGSIPEGYECFGDIRIFQVHGNRLNGSLPANFSSWRSLSSFYVLNNRLSGTLPCEYHQWQSLAHFDVSGNDLSGSLPSNFSMWSVLETFECSRNRLSGTVPSAYGTNWSRLTRFDVSHNKLVGTLPSDFASWLQMEDFHVNDNSFNGSIPSNYQSWNALTTFRVSSNRLGGSLSPEFAQWALLQDFSVSSNRLTGTLSSDFQQWVYLKTFDVSENLLSGTLPSEYAAWRNLTSFRCDNNSFTGLLPEGYGIHWQRVTHLGASSNQLSGSLPVSYVASMQSLVALELGNNSFSGTMPSEWQTAASAALQWIHLEFNSLSGTLLLSPNWTLISSYRVPSNYLSGPLPPSDVFDALPHLVAFVASNNRLTGTIPASLMRPSMAYIMLNNNSFSGTITAHPNASTMSGNMLHSKGYVFVIALHRNAGLRGMIPATMPRAAFMALCDTSFCGTIPTVFYEALFTCIDGFILDSFEKNLQLMLASGSLWAYSQFVLPSCPIPLSPRIGNLSVTSHSTPSWVPSVFQNVMSASPDVAALGASLASGGSSALSVWRISLMSTMRQCRTVSGAEGLFEADVSVGNSPLRLRIGPSLGAMHRGAVVGNVAVWVAVAVAAYLVCWSVARFKSTSCAAVAASFRLPSSGFIGIGMLLQQVVVSSVLLLRVTSPEAWETADTSIGVAGLVVVCGLFAALCKLLPLNSQVFEAFPRGAARRLRRAQTSSPPHKRRSSQGSLLCCTSARIVLHRWVAPGVVWHNRSTLATLFVERYGLLFASCRRGRHWWLVPDLAVTVFLCVLAGLVPSDPRYCSATMWCSVAVSALWCAASVVLWPKHRRAAGANLVFTSLAQVAASLCSVLDVDDHVSSVFASVAGLVSMLVTVGIFALDYFLLRRNKKSEVAAPAATSQLSQQSASKEEVPHIRHVVNGSRDSLCNVPHPVLPSVNSNTTIRSTTFRDEVAARRLRDIVEAICDRSRAVERDLWWRAS